MSGSECTAGWNLAELNIGRLRAPLDDAIARLARLDALGPTAEAFTFRQPFASPHVTQRVLADDRDVCPA